MFLFQDSLFLEFGFGIVVFVPGAMFLRFFFGVFAGVVMAFLGAFFAPACIPGPPVGAFLR